ncbi:MAG TPA: GvpL/GvpF family gas vesicle protein, partial [Ktedonobacterales bacterium]|nr:GvpL/GvpF family gas vesicle protein [Ktedonobacterales bacterium]
PGLHDALLSMVAWQDLAAVISPIESATLPTLPAYALRHEAVVEGLCQAGPALPARFGTILADQAAVAQAIAGKYEALLADLARVGDKVELGLTILWDTPVGQGEEKAEQQASVTAAPASSTSGAGTRYLEARLAQYRRETTQQNQARAVIAHLEQVLAPYRLEQRYRILPLPRLAVRAAYLVQPRHIQDFQRSVDEMRQHRPDLRWLLSGPWPPYTFVTGAGRLFQQGAGLKLDGRDAEGGIV